MIDSNAGYPVAIPPRGPIHVLMNCIGRRIELLDAFRAAGKAMRRRVVVWGTDRSWTAPGMHCVDHAVLSPAIDDPGYVDFLVQLVRKNRISLAVPLIDSDLLKLSQARPDFATNGCTLLISSPRVVAICRDKMLAFHHLRRSGIDTPQTWTLDDVIAQTRPKFPLYIKPRSGSAARGHYVCEDRESLLLLARRVPDPIVQEFVEGVEFTLDAYAAFDGVPRCVVPRRRIEVRTGEVSKGEVVMDKEIIALGKRVVESLGECVGVITIQCIRSADGRTRVIEINPRVGGGLPLGIRAGADAPLWIMQELSGRTPRIDPRRIRDGLMMLRYDSSVFCERLPKRRTARGNPRRARG